MIEQPNHITICNKCYTPAQPEYQLCINCKSPKLIENIIEMNFEEYLNLERAPCANCEAPKITKASYCFACKKN
jgi:hypothetical protein